MAILVPLRPYFRCLAVCAKFLHIVAALKDMG